LYDSGPDTTLIIDLSTDTLKNDVTVSEIIDREFTEL